MNRSRLLIIAGACLSLLAPHARAQAPASKPKSPLGHAAVSDKSAAEVEADLAREGRRAQARALLFTLSAEARGFRDQTLRARSLARVADALWGVAAEQGRVLFREAWEAAEKADREGQGQLDLRRVVLALAARRDPQLAEEFLRKLKAEQPESKPEPGGNTAPAGTNVWELPEALEKRLNLAEHLLSAGDIERALHFADPVLGGVTISTVEFLTELREKDPAAADRRYALMLANTVGSVTADANTVSVLSSYIFTPHLYFVFNRSGGVDSAQMRAPSPPAGVSPQLRLAFFQTARGVMLRPQPSPEQDYGTAGIAGKYMALKRLLPLFERYAPTDIAAAMRGHFEVLNSQVGDRLRQSEDEALRKGLGTEATPAEQERTLSQAVERAGTADERDELYFKMALLALGKDDAAALVYVGKIEDLSFRERARAWVDWGLAVNAIGKKKVEAALERARDGELTHVQRVWVLTRSAKLLAEADRDRALSLLDEAASEIRLIDRADPDRARGWLAVANALRLLEPSRAWDAVSDAVEAANTSEGFTGEGGAINVNVNSKSQIMKKSERVPDFDIAGVFGEAARADFDRAAQLARGFKAEAPRVNAVIAISAAVLREKGAAAPAAPRAATKD
jgi:hypothetical protein